MKDYIAALEALKRSTESLANALQIYSDWIDSQIPTKDEKFAMEATAESVDEWLKQI